MPQVCWSCICRSWPGSGDAWWAVERSITRKRCYLLRSEFLNPKVFPFWSWKSSRTKAWHTTWFGVFWSLSAMARALATLPGWPSAQLQLRRVQAKDVKSCAELEAASYPADEAGWQNVANGSRLDTLLPFIKPNWAYSFISRRNVCRTYRSSTFLVLQLTTCSALQAASPENLELRQKVAGDYFWAAVDALSERQLWLGYDFSCLKDLKDHETGVQV